MYFSVILCTDQLYHEAKSYFLQQWRSDLLAKQEASLIWAYLITDYFKQNWKSWFYFMDWVYSYENIYFSTSHSEDLLIFAVDNKKVAVDIEYIHTRDRSLLRNVKVPNSPYSKRENFYIQRAAKECLVKFLNLTSNDMKDMKVSKFDPHKHYLVDERWFPSLITLRLRWVEYWIHINIKNGRVIALLQEDERKDEWLDNQKNSNRPPVPPLPNNWPYLCSMEREWMFKPIDF